MTHDDSTRSSVIRRRSVLTSIVAAGTAAAIGGCSNGSATGSDTLVLWDYQQQPEKAYLARLSDFSHKTGIKIQRVVIKYEDFLKKILQAAAADQLPDILMIDNPWNSAMADQGVLADLTSRIEAWGQWHNYYDGPKDAATWDGHVYAVPNESNALTMYYDKTLFDREGVEAPTTWDELRRVARELTRGDRYGIALPMTNSENSVFTFESFMWQAGADLDSMSSPEALSAMEFVKALLDDGSMSSEVLSWDLRGTVTELVNGRAAIAYGGTWDMGWITDNLPEDREVGVALLPAGAESADSNLGGENWAITATSTMQDEAWQLIEFANSPDGQMPYLVESGQLPSRKDLADRKEFTKAPYPTLLEQLEVARARVYGPDYPKMSDAIVKAFQSVLSGQTSPKEAMDEAARTITPLSRT
jgi:multiple sugar transport system substrate-binding protein